MSTDMDTRLQAAAEGLRRVAATIEVPAWEPDEGYGTPARVTSTARLRLMLAVAAVALIAVVVVAVAERDRGEPAASGADTIPILVPVAMPDDFQPTGGADLPLSSGERPDLSMTVYGHPAADDPFAAGDLAILVSRGEEPTEEPLEGVPVRGTQGAFVQELSGRTGLAWQEAPGVDVVVASGTMSRDELVTVAEGLRFGPDARTVETGPLPGGLDALGSLPRATFASTGVSAAVPADAPGHLIGFQAREGGAGVLVVTTVAGGSNELAVLRWFLGRDSRRVAVRGTTGWLGVGIGGDGTNLLVWEQAPGVVVIVEGDVGENGVLTAAESLRPATEEEWAGLKNPPPQGSAPRVPPQGTVVAQGTASDGNAWRLTLGGGPSSGEPCFDLLTTTGATSVCGGLPGGASRTGADVYQPLVFDDDRYPHFVFGQAPATTVTVRVTNTDGTGIETSASELDGHVFYAVELPAGAEPVEVTFLTSDSNEIDRIALTD